MALFKRSNDEEETSFEDEWTRAEEEAAGLDAPIFGGAAVDNHRGEAAPEPAPAPAPAPEPAEGERPEADAPADAAAGETAPPEGDEAAVFADIADVPATGHVRVKETMRDIPDDLPPAPSGAILPAGATAAGQVEKVGKHGRAAAPAADPEPDLPEHQVHSRRMRRQLIIVAVLLILAVCAVVAFGVLFVMTGADDSDRAAADATTDTLQVQQTADSAHDASADNQKVTSVPMLLPLLGMEQDEAVEALGHGATVTLETEQTDDKNPVKKLVTVMLTDEPSDSHSSTTPTVYLGIGADTKTVIRVGYAVSTASLGYGSLSFADAIGNEHVIEKTLNAAGLNVLNGAVALPGDSSAYSTYASDGKTLMSEKYSFSGACEVGGDDYDWEAVLSYDYTAANATGNLADCIRQISVYAMPDPVPELKAPEAPKADEKKDGAPAAEGQPAEGQADGAQPAAEAQPAEGQAA